MTDPHRIQGPSGSPEPSVPKKDRTVGPDDFKKYMVEEVKEIDAEQRGRKRKRREEGEEDTEAEKKAVGAGPQAPTAAPIGKVEGGPLASTGGAAPTLPPPSTSAGPPTTATPDFKPEDIEQFAWEDEARRVASQPPPAASPPTQGAPPPTQAAAPQTPVEQEPDIEAAQPPQQYYSEGEDSSYQYQYEQDSRWSSYVQPTLDQPQSASQQSTSGSDQPPRRGGTEKTKETAPSPAEKKSSPQKRGTKKKPAEASKLLAKEGKAKKSGPGEFKSLMEEPKAPEDKKKAASSQQPQQKEPETATKGRMAAPTGEMPEPMTGAVLPEKPVRIQPEEETAGPLGALPSTKKEAAGKIPTKKPEEQKEEEEAEKEIPSGLAMTPSGAQAGQGDTGKEGKPKEEREFVSAPLTAGPLPIAGMPTGIITPVATGTPALASVSPYAELHPEILSLFERMIGVLTVMKTAGITETTLILSERAFAGTVLRGTSITISEYKFAAGELNLEFSGSPQAIALLQQNLPSLATALSRAGLVVKRTDFIFSRKEAPGERGEGEKEHERGRGSR